MKCDYTIGLLFPELRIASVQTSQDAQSMSSTEALSARKVLENFGLGSL